MTKEEIQNKYQKETQGDVVEDNGAPTFYTNKYTDWLQDKLISQLSNDIPSDEEIWEMACKLDSFKEQLAFNNGVKWGRDFKIKGSGNLPPSPSKEDKESDEVKHSSQDVYESKESDCEHNWHSASRRAGDIYAYCDKCGGTK